MTVSPTASPAWLAVSEKGTLSSGSCPPLKSEPRATTARLKVTVTASLPESVPRAAGVSEINSSPSPARKPAPVGWAISSRQQQVAAVTIVMAAGISDRTNGGRAGSAMAIHTDPVRRFQDTKAQMGPNGPSKVI